jgi:N-acetylmuramic acid 6-phosphate etherase
MTVEARVDDPATERPNEASTDLDLRSTAGLVRLINAEDSTVPAAVLSAATPLAEAIDMIVARLEGGGRLVYVGAGSSGRLAAIDAAECPATFGVEPELVLALVAEEDELEDDAEAGARAVAAAGVGAVDAVVALSASGKTPYVLGAVEEARGAGAATIAIVCAHDTPLAAAAERAVEVVVGPEVIAGSTRMKAGTAQKLVLNTISTAAMVRLGKTYGNLMVDVVGGNAKQRARARRAVELATGASDSAVDAALEAAGGEAKVAIVSLLAEVEPAEARARLQRNGGRVRPSLEDA